MYQYVLPGTREFGIWACVDLEILLSSILIPLVSDSDGFVLGTRTDCCVVFTLNRPFYPASSAHPVSVLIPYPGEILILWPQTVRQRKTKKSPGYQGMYKIIANSSVKQAKYQRTGYDNL